MFDRALIPFDGSTQFDTLLPSVTRFARGLHMPLVLASVLAPGPTATLEQRRQEADGHLQEIVARLTGAGVEATAAMAHLARVQPEARASLRAAIPALRRAHTRRDGDLGLARRIAHLGSGPRIVVVAAVDGRLAGPDPLVVAADAVEAALREGPEKAMATFNRLDLRESKEE